MVKRTAVAVIEMRLKLALAGQQTTEFASRDEAIARAWAVMIGYTKYNPRPAL